jgi:hypothetical protein
LFAAQPLQLAALLLLPNDLHAIHQQPLLALPDILQCLLAFLGLPTLFGHAVIATLAALASALSTCELQANVFSIKPLVLLINMLLPFVFVMVQHTDALPTIFVQLMTFLFQSSTPSFNKRSLNSSVITLPLSSIELTPSLSQRTIFDATSEAVFVMLSLSVFVTLLIFSWFNAFLLLFGLYMALFSNADVPLQLTSKLMLLLTLILFLLLLPVSLMAPQLSLRSVLCLLLLSMTFPIRMVIQVSTVVTVMLMSVWMTSLLIGRFLFPVQSWFKLCPEVICCLGLQRASMTCLGIPSCMSQVPK